jgi:hypothetical protein
MILRVTEGREFMTPHEKLALETSVGLIDTAAALLKQDAAFLILLADHLPNLTEQARVQLRTDSELRLISAQKQTVNARHLESILKR